MIIKKIFNKEFDEEVHSDFLKFGKGEFQDKYLIEAKKQKDKWIIKTGPEYANNLVRLGLRKCTGEVKVSGVIVSTFDLKKEEGGEVFNSSEKVKQFMGVKQLVISGEIAATRIIEMMDKYPRAFFALSFNLPDFELKIKAKAPKSAKPSTKGDKDAKADFCTLKTTDEKIAREIFFDVDNFKEISIRHNLHILEMIYPENVSSLKPEEVRAQSKRKGKLTRKLIIDGREVIKKSEFVA